jgi:hypothetical protein
MNTEPREETVSLEDVSPASDVPAADETNAMDEATTPAADGE